jgi:23S rRNA (guanosine2251-2'-O)-methyltransferase
MPGKRTTEERLVIAGANAVAEALRSPLAIERVYLAHTRVATAVATLAERRGVPVEWVPVAALARLALGAHHQGVVARAAPYPYLSLEEVVAAPGRGLLLLDGIQDPRNLGAVLRTARAAGVQGVILPRHGSVHVTSTVISASAGVALHVGVSQVTNLAQAMGRLKEDGYWLVGLAVGAEGRLDQIDPLEKPALVLGGEGDGLRPLVRRHCDFLARIPMAAGVESLNASVAAGIALYEVLMRPH